MACVKLPYETLQYLMVRVAHIGSHVAAVEMLLDGVEILVHWAEVC